VIRSPLHNHRLIVFSILALIFMVRAVVPSGWMPSSVAGQMITICNGAGVTKAWLGVDGQIHKDAPDDTSPMDDPCVYASMTLAFADDVAGHSPAKHNGEERAHRIVLPTIGQGLAAPPPYSTGPPLLI
jgi:hypothetical protein